MKQLPEKYDVGQRNRAIWFGKVNCCKIFLPSLPSWIYVVVTSTPVEDFSINRIATCKMSNPEPQIQISLHQLTASPTRPPGAPYDLPQPVHLADIARGLNQTTISDNWQPLPLTA